MRQQVGRGAHDRAADRPQQVGAHHRAHGIQPYRPAQSGGQLVSSPVKRQKDQDFQREQRVTAPAFFHSVSPFQGTAQSFVRLRACLVFNRLSGRDTVHSVRPSSRHRSKASCFQVS